MKRAAVAVLVVSFAGPCAADSSDNPLGLYMGGALGQASVSLTTPYSNYDFHQHDTGWQAFLGLRPISLLAAQLEYVDFGSPSVSASSQQVGYYVTDTADLHQRAAMLSGLVFAPIPLPFLDVYAKAGIARLQSVGHAFFYVSCQSSNCPLGPNLPSVNIDNTEGRFAYGAGAQLKLAAFALRMEYERISASGDPQLLSIGLAWSF